MKKTITLLFLIISYLTFSQVSNEGKPKSWEFKNQFQPIPAVKMPVFDIEELLAEDAVNDHTGEKPWRFGKEFMVDYHLDNSGEWTILEDGSRVWRIRFISKQAKTLNFLFEDFYLPEGGTVYLYSSDRQDLLGAYTHHENNEERVLGSWLVSGEDVWIEYHEPADAIGEGTLKIGRVVHGYRSQSDYNVSKDLNWSGNCNQDVDCPIDPSLEDFKNHNKKGVVLLLVGTSSFCSGSLINNTSNNGVPYILTANHCYSNPSVWSFRFNWISPNPVCAQTANSTNGPTNQVMSGAVLRARRANTDFCLLEINNPIPSSWDVVWNGWNRGSAVTSKSFGIHHPSGDIMKVSVDMNSPQLMNNPNRIAWEVSNWELGMTEGGSSGSPLFDDNGRIIGQLWGGSAACIGNTTNSNGGYDDYGRFNVSWDAGGLVSNQLKNWLDPTNTGAVTLDPYPPMVAYTLDAAVLVTNIEQELCTPVISPVIEVKNNGLNTLTSAVVTYQLSNGTPATINWTGSLEQGETDTINVVPITITEDGSFSASISNPNNGTDQNDINNQSEISYTMVPYYETEQVLLVLRPDNYGSETTWNLKNSSGTILYSGGPYSNFNTDQIDITFNLPTEDCYTFTINDQHGDGICCDYGNGFYRLELPNGMILNQEGNFEDQAVYMFSNKSNLSVGAVENIDAQIGLYPNPTNGIVNIANKTGETLQYEVFNVLGQRVLGGTSTTSDFSLDLTFGKGVYLVKFTNTATSSTSVKKVIVR